MTVRVLDFQTSLLNLLGTVEFEARGFGEARFNHGLAHALADERTDDEREADWTAQRDEAVRLLEQIAADICAAVGK